MPKPNMVALGEVQSPENLPKHEVEIANENDPRSLVNLVPVAMADAIRNVAGSFPHYLAESEVELQHLLKPTELDDRLRIAFWAEYQRAQDAGQKLMLKNVFGSLIGKSVFYDTIISNPQRVAWIIKPPEEYMLSCEASLHNGKNTMAKIMRMEIFDTKGNIKKTEAQLFLKAYELLENRVRGAVVQRSLSAHMHARVSDENPDASRKELEELEAKRSKVIEVASADQDQTADE